MHTFLLHDLLKQAAARYPQKQALVFRDEMMTYSDLDSLSDRLASYLIRSGAAIGDRIGLLLPKSPASIVSLFAILKAGAAYVPIDSQIPSSRALKIIDNCGMRALITTAMHFQKLATEGPDITAAISPIIVIDGNTQALSERFGRETIASLGEILDQDVSPLASRPMSDVNPAYILYTSGSTGEPKGVMISHVNALTFVTMAAEYFQITDRDRMASHAPLHFDLSVFDIYVAIRCGATIILIPEHLSAFPLKLVEYIDEKDVSVWNSASSVLVMLSDRGRIDRFALRSLRLVHFSGDIMPIKNLRFYMGRFPRTQFYNIYGQTEANSSLCYHVESVPAEGTIRIPIGKPFPNFEVFALDADHRVVTGPDQEGELYVKSSTVALGYWRALELTEEKFVPDPRDTSTGIRVYRTGDMVRTDAEGLYIFVGRKDHMIKSRGHRIELPEIESVLTNHPLVRHAAVVALPDEQIGYKILAFVSLIERADLDSESLMAYCGKFLPKYMVPEVIELRASLQITSSGKIDRKALADEAAKAYPH